jgi:RIO kinase 1
MSTPDWLIGEPDPYQEYDLGPLKGGKEAEIFVTERVLGDRSCLLAHKRYRPRRVATKGELQTLGFQRSASFVNDHAYRAGRRIPDARAQRAVDRKTRFGRVVRAAEWSGEEWKMLQRLSDAGVHVPYPVARTADGVIMQFLGNRSGAAALLVEDLHRMVRAGVVHADLSAHNILWWEDRTWIIDVPQAVDLVVNIHAFDFLIRDLRNVGAWFTRRRIAFDADAIFSDLLSNLSP